MLRRILNESQDELVAENRRLLAGLQQALARFDAATEDQETLERSALQLDELFLLVVAGEFNAGKSAFINALLGSRVLEEGVTPTTTRVHLVKYGPAVERVPVESALDVITAPVELLRDINIVDTPGTNAIHREHEAITREFVPRSDMVLFVTSADRPFTESERAFLQGIRDWGKKIVVVINKIDILETEEEVARVVEFVAENARTLLGAAPEVFPVAARLALRAKEAGDDSLLAKSRFGALERYVAGTLDERERVRLKLLNPLGVGEHLAQKYLGITEGRLGLLKEDFTAIEDIERQMALYKEDMQREFRFRLADVDVVLHEFENRGITFFDDTMRLTRVFDLMNKSKMKADFERQVVADLPQRVDRRVTEIIDWLVNADLRQWQAVTEHLARRRQEHADRIVGQVGRSFDFDRTRLLDSVGRAAQRSVETYDRERESSRLAESVQVAVAGTALAEVGALGLGAVLTHLAVSAAADFTGILAASAVAVLGLFIIPNRRGDAKRDLRKKIAAMREQLMGSLTGQFDREVEGSLRRIDEAIGPYTRFVRAERDRLTAAREELAAASQGLARLRSRVEALS
ncbi:MAG TPA: dynamin family protein [Thermoanaerobaculia bacterium]|nr:dynamin family protein [Thermoanaerobaculia bacterium]